METKTDTYKAAIKCLIEQGKVEAAMEAIDTLARYTFHIGMQYAENCNQNKSDSDDRVLRQTEGTMQEEFDKQQKKIKFDLDLKGSPFDFNNILQEMQELYEKKNHDYGNSFSETIQEFGLSPAIARINDKFKRVKQMVKGEQMLVKESMRDNLIDIANYCILTIIEIDKSS